MNLSRTVRAASVAILILPSACTGQSRDARSGSSAGEQQILATLDGGPITIRDVGPKIGDDLARLDMQYQMIRSQMIEAALDSALRERTVGAEAKRRGISIDSLISAEAATSAIPSDADVTHWYQENQSRLGGRALDSIRPQIVELLRRERLEAAAIRLEDRLMKERHVSVKFSPYRLSLENSNSPTLGNANAPVTLVEFSDFQCPFCRQFIGTLKQVEKNYPRDVKIVYRQFPIESIHQYAPMAAEASLCAAEQGKFWQLHDMMFADQSKLTVADLKEKAGVAGADRAKFDACLGSRKYTTQVERDIAEGTRLGVNGTPAIFVNGIELKGGAVPYAVVDAAIRKELRRAKR